MYFLVYDISSSFHLTEIGTLTLARTHMYSLDIKLLSEFTLFSLFDFLGIKMARLRLSGCVLAVSFYYFLLHAVAQVTDPSEGEHFQLNYPIFSFIDSMIIVSDKFTVINFIS